MQADPRQADDQSVRARIWADRDWVPLAQAIVEKSCPVFGLDQKGTGRLTMAVEEVLMHLARTAKNTEICLDIQPGGWYVAVRLSFYADPSDLWAMNLTAVPMKEDTPDLDHLGLVLASRMTDRFDLTVQAGRVLLTLRRDLPYPTVTAEPGQRIIPKGPLTIISDPDPDLIKAACIRALGLYRPEQLHHSFFKPGKLADMVARGDMAMAVALTKALEPAGAVCWQGNSGITFFGPYAFDQTMESARLLINHLIQRVARTGAKGMFSGRATQDLPPGDFESLGTYGPGNKTTETRVWYRHLGEDPGTSVWSHPDLIPFLEKTYQALWLMRQIRPTQNLGEQHPERSVLSARLRPEASEALLVPLVGGRDMAGCLADHVAALQAEGLDRILFQTDLSSGWQAALGRAALDAGFTPKLVLPYGGKSDILVFQYESV